ncbi:zinc-ribbon domain-containing protein [Bifidobacterium tissieri]|uniref:Zinc-ribbon domain-containing protein n=2 Tax=Bifidobacterium tissieri TaxID=1630162 RepID=A0A5M9ZMX9_9BIFI|nr:zinc-ribbon domain-containing protein [Bifidobacterium tissieri]
MTKICTHCGAAVEPDALFCSNCGAPVPPDDAGSTSESPTRAMPNQPVPEPSMTGAQPTGAQPTGAQPKKTNAIVPIIIAAVVAALVVTGGVAYEVLRIMGNNNAASPQSSATTTQTQAPTATASSTPEPSLNTDKLQSIVNSYSSTDAAVSVRPVEDGDEFDSQQANSKFVAAGFYLPVYLSAKDSGSASAMSSAESMMRTMSNDDGNTAIDDLGGLSALNGWSSGAGYGNTDFQRMFGDVAASNSGYENYTSASDATKMLAATAKAGGTDLMSFDLASEGVNAPSGTTLNGHRGQGIKDSYNFFVLMKTGKTDVAVTVLTQNMGKDRAAALTSDILAEVATEVK